LSWGRRGHFCKHLSPHVTSQCDLSAGDYESSLLTKGRQTGICTFIAPLEEGSYTVRLVRNESEDLGSSVFHVIRAAGRVK